MIQTLQKLHESPVNVQKAVIAHTKGKLKTTYDKLTDADYAGEMCHYANLIGLLYYTKCTLLDHFGKVSAENNPERIDKKTFGRKLKEALFDEFTDDEFIPSIGAIGSAEDEDGFYQKHKRAKEVRDRMVEFIFDGEKVVSLKKLIDFNHREFAILLIREWQKEGVLILINVHQIKGLEFDVVFYDPTPGGWPKDTPEHIISPKNVDYVARSRARYALYLLNADETKRRAPTTRGGTKTRGPTPSTDTEWIYLSYY